MGGVVFGDEQDAGGVAVEAVHNAGAQITCRAREGAEAVEQGVHQGSRVHAGARVDDHAGGFIDGDDIFIFVEDGERDLFRSGVERSGAGGLDDDGIARSSQVRRAARVAVDADTAVLDPILQAGAAELGKTLVEDEIQALSGLLGCQLDL